MSLNFGVSGRGWGVIRGFFELEIAQAFIEFEFQLVSEGLGLLIKAPRVVLIDLLPFHLTSNCI
jgi:hypothetical protein